MEVFKTITGSENYEVSNFGRVRNKKTGKILKGRKSDWGYIIVYLNQNGRRKNVKAHRMCAIEFIENPNNYPCVNHKDGNKENNHISNLEWCTYSQNNAHAYQTGLKTGKGAAGTLNSQSKLSEYDVLNIREMLNIGHSCTYISTFFPVGRDMIYLIKVGKTWKHI